MPDTTDSPVPPIIRILERSAQRLGMTLEVLDETSKLLVEIRDGNRRRLLHAGTSPLNDAVACRLARDKFYTALVLRRAGLRTPTTVRCLKPGHFRNGTYGLVEGPRPALRFLEERSSPIVIKPNGMSFGRFVTVVREPTEVVAALEALWHYDSIGLAQEKAEGSDYRLDFLDGEFWAGYHRFPLQVRGDGLSTLRQLIVAVDARFGENLFWERVCRSPDWEQSAGAQQLEAGSVLASGRNLTLGGEILNLNRFAVCEPIFEVAAPWIDFGKRIARAMGLRHLGVDLKMESLESDPARAIIIEVNSSPVLVQFYRMGYEEEVLAAYGKVLRRAFDH